MLDVCIGDAAADVGPALRERHVPDRRVVRRTARQMWGVEAIMLSAGTNVEWLCDDMGLIDAPADSHAVASGARRADGVVYVPALLGLGTPSWDYGARGTLLGLTRGTERAHIVRAVLEGVAHRGADMVDAAEADTGLDDPGPADRRRHESEPDVRPGARERDAASRSRCPRSSSRRRSAPAFLAGVADGTWATLAETAEAFRPAVRVEPTERLDRSAWAEALARAARWIPELSALDF